MDALTIVGRSALTIETVLSRLLPVLGVRSRGWRPTGSTFLSIITPRIGACLSFSYSILRCGTEIKAYGDQRAASKSIC